MLFRALFWIGLVALLAPRPAEFGIERLGSFDIPHIGVGAGTDVHLSQIGLEGGAFVDHLRSDLFARLRKVRADIEEADLINRSHVRSRASFF